MCKQHYVQLDVEPHIITISSVEGSSALNVSANEISQINFAEAANDDDDSRIFDDCSDLADSQSISAEDMIKPKYAYT